MHYFYSQNISVNTIQLSKEEAHHAARVLRLQLDDLVGVFDGEGSIYTCKISSISKNACSLTIETVNKSAKEASKLSLFIAPTKNIDRLEWFFEKATEIGLAEIGLLLSDHSERKNVRYDRLEKVLVSAMKQSMNPYLPRLRELISFNEALDLYPEADRFISHCEDRSKKDLFKELDYNKKSVIMIGPEGDFSPQEIDKAEEKGWIGVSMGDQRLRTETAGVLAVHMYALKENNS
jgi:16S rRNA (uracil1498-N3)-methyltransferase